MELFHGINSMARPGGGEGPVLNRIDVTNIGSGWPYNEYPNMYQFRIFDGNDKCLKKFAFINNQATVSRKCILSAPIPDPSQSSADITFTMESNDGNAEGVVDEPFSHPTLQGLYKHTVTLSSMIKLVNNKRYLFPVRMCGNNYHDYTIVATNASLPTTYGCCLAADLDNHANDAANSSWSNWYEIRYVHNLKHPYFLELWYDTYQGYPV